MWNALKILDASDVDNPEASSGMYELIKAENFFLLCYCSYYINPLLVTNLPTMFLCRVEVYSLRVVPKSLAGKPEGWNSESITKVFSSF